MPFTFRLQSVLKYRKRIVDDKGRAVAVAQGEVARWHARQTELEAEINACLNEQQSAGLKVQDLVAKTAWLEHLRSRRTELESELSRARLELAAAQEELQASWRDLEVLKQLRQKQEMAWFADQEIRERKELDEIGQIRSERAWRSNLAPKRA